jgi:hypothetical protein
MDIQLILNFYITLKLHHEMGIHTSMKIMVILIFLPISSKNKFPQRGLFRFFYEEYNLDEQKTSRC